MSELVDKDAFLKQERKWYCENCDRRKGVKNGRKCFVYEIGEVPCRACDVDDVLDDLESFETIAASPWHMAEEPPKEEHRTYLVYTDTGYMCSCRWTNNMYGLGESDRWGWSIADVPQFQKVTHWMPIEPPKEEEHGNK